MKLAAARAIAKIAREDVPERIREAYPDAVLTFGPDYILPKPMDPRLLVAVSPAVARAAMETGVARRPISDWDTYAESLKRYGAECADGVCYPVLLNSREALEKLAARYGFTGL